MDVGKIQQAIDLGDILTDYTNLGKMQDLYPIGLSSIPVVKALMEKNYWHEVFYILPVARWFEAVRNETIDRSTRILIPKLSFIIHMKFVDTIEQNKLNKNISRAGIVNKEKNYYMLHHWRL
ncbi:hypothetical protein TRFO_21791 [Tritrichomonas foetus]|uniref:Uncharacterized protein n=1 Tax=Tritrichomonas foetus TaxID=1144522 RepID=A0A1J4KEF8_9EUKA|nr:hypothetical protein TRFO_21791 [Tritrichomonas foetus]|eukprot:OHT09312.1 hypothetical protein TRFO_21791 [Tritrichomonas foetus]